MFTKKAEKGFTLIELLVVIAIIGLLASTVLAAMGSARESGRDARRISDLKQVQTALELYRNANAGQYPTNPPAPAANQVSAMTTGTYNISPYMPTIPTDPVYTGANGYGYAVGANRGSYTLRVRLERNSALVPAWCKITLGTGSPAWEAAYQPCY